MTKIAKKVVICQRVGENANEMSKGASCKVADLMKMANLTQMANLANDADGNENVEKTIGFISKTTTLHVYHAFLYIS